MELVQWVEPDIYRRPAPVAGNWSLLLRAGERVDTLVNIGEKYV